MNGLLRRLLGPRTVEEYQPMEARVSRLGTGCALHFVFDRQELVVMLPKDSALAFQEAILDALLPEDDA